VAKKKIVDEKEVKKNCYICIEYIDCRYNKESKGKKFNLKPCNNFVFEEFLTKQGYHLKGE
jgi:hypothetical protein